MALRQCLRYYSFQLPDLDSLPAAVWGFTSGQQAFAEM